MASAGVVASKLKSPIHLRSRARNLLDRFDSEGTLFRRRARAKNWEAEKTGGGMEFGGIGEMRAASLSVLMHARRTETVALLMHGEGGEQDHSIA